MLGRIKHLIPAVVWSIFILILSVLPGGSLPKIGWDFVLDWDKIAHFGVYMILCLLLGYGIRQKRKIKFNHLLKIFLLSVTFGAVLEGIQYWLLTDRLFEVPDLIANINGSLAGTFIVHLLRDKKKSLWISQ